MKLVFFLFSLAVAGIGADVMAPDWAVCSSLGLPIPFMFRALPLVTAAVCFFVLTINSRKDESTQLWRFVRRSQLIERFILAGAVSFAVLSGLDFFCSRRVADYCLIPVTLVTVAGFGFTIRTNRAELRSVRQLVKKNRLIERFILTSAVLGCAWMSTHVYFQNTVAKVSVQGVSEADSQQLQAALPFKTVMASDSEGVSICFARAAGRTKQIRSILSRYTPSIPSRPSR